MTYKIKSLNEVNYIPVNFLFSPYILLGTVTIIAGPPGIGKSTITQAWTAMVSKGESDLHMPANVLYQNAEDNYAATVKNKLDKMGANCERIYYAEENLDLTHYGEWRDILDEVQPKLVVIDPLQAFIGGANINKSNEIRPVMDKILKLADEFDTAFLVTTHTRKARTTNSILDSQGSIDIVAAVRSYLQVIPCGSDTNKCIIKHLKSNIDKCGKNLEFSFDKEGYHFTELVGTQEDRIDEVISMIINMVVRRGEWSGTMPKLMSELNIVGRTSRSLGKLVWSNIAQREFSENGIKVWKTRATTNSEENTKGARITNFKYEE